MGRHLYMFMRFIFISGLIILVSGCVTANDDAEMPTLMALSEIQSIAVFPVASFTPVPTATYTPLPTLTPSPSLSPTVTLTPTITPSPLPTHTPLPTETPVPLSRIVFSSQRDGNNNIYTMNRDGSDVQQLTSSSDGEWYPVWSPDYQQIAYARGNARSGDRIYIMDADGYNQRPLEARPQQGIEPNWSPDGRYVAFTSGRDGSHDIYITNMSTGVTIQLTNTSDHDEQPMWSPMTNDIAISSEGDIMLVSIRDGTLTRTLVSSSQLEVFPDISPDGQTLLFCMQVNDNIDLYTVPINGGTSERLTWNPGFDCNGRWSPDGQAIIFASNRDGDMEIYIMIGSENQLYQLTHNTVSDNFPDW